MHTFNLSFVFNPSVIIPGGAVVTIVCHSEDQINESEIMATATKYYNKVMKPGVNMKKAFNQIVAGVKNDCGIDAVMVAADCAMFATLS